MFFKNTPNQGLYIFAKGADGAPRPGDAENISMFISLGGAGATPSTNSVNDIGGGLYYLALEQAETNADVFAVYGASSTPDVGIDPTMVVTQGGAVPKVDHGTDGGLYTRGPVVANLDEIGGANFDASFALDQQSTLAQQYASIKGLFDTETWAELTAIPDATPTTAALLMMLYHQARNKVVDDRDAGVQQIHNDAGLPIGRATRDDDGTQFTREKFVDES